MSLYGAIRPALFRLPPETAHRLSIWALRAGSGAWGKPPEAHPSLAQDLFGLRFPNPLGLAAGYDKNGEAPDAAARLGFGFVEVGTVTPLPQSGNARPRLFRLPEDRAVINRLGFNNDGIERLGARLARRRNGAILGVNLGANRTSTDRVADYVAGLAALYRLADYFVINVSSPNTPGLRELQKAEALDTLIQRVFEARAALAGTERPKPVLLKIAPDLEAGERAEIASLALSRQVDGLIVGNTTLRRDNLRSSVAGESGGLSGAPLFALSTAVLADFCRLTNGALPLIGVGGIASGLDAYRKIRAGASLVQLYTGLVYGGPGLPRRIVRDLAGHLARDGLSHIREAVGLDAR